jgi:hypothetical protein
VVDCTGLENRRIEFWKRGRVVDCTGLENRQRETVREFESHRFRQLKQALGVD